MYYIIIIKHIETQQEVRRIDKATKLSVNNYTGTWLHTNSDMEVIIRAYHQ